MTLSRSLMLGACLALPLGAAATAHAQPVQPGSQVIQVPPGAVVMIVPAPVAATAAPMVLRQAAPMTVPPIAAGDPVLRLIAQQQAMMQHMMAQMNAMFPPMPTLSPFGPGALTSVALPAGGHGVCSESVSIVSRGDGSAPIVHVSRSGDACGAAGGSEPEHVVTPPVPTQPPHGPRVLEVSNPPRPVHARAPAHT